MLAACVSGFAVPCEMAQGFRGFALLDEREIRAAFDGQLVSLGSGGDKLPGRGMAG